MLIICKWSGLHSLRMIDLTLFHVPCLVVDLGQSQLFNNLFDLILCTTSMYKRNQWCGSEDNPRKLVVDRRRSGC